MTVGGKKVGRGKTIGQWQRDVHVCACAWA